MTFKMTILWEGLSIHNDSIDMASPQCMSSYDLSDNNSERRPSHNDIIDMASPQCMSSYDLTDNNYLISPFNIYFIIRLHTIVYQFVYFYIVSFENILSQYVHWYRLPSLCIRNDSQAQYDCTINVRSFSSKKRFIILLSLIWFTPVFIIWWL